ncbi:hypothetical protein FRC03_000014 [Tulasnella sp. 419]|nr:hypothetical protein FRC03_000014 [Tulasnella sp. 419]
MSSANQPLETDFDPLFPPPKPVSSILAPKSWPGVSHESGTELSKLLRMDYDQFHCFFNKDGFHNHLSHHLFATYSFGASPKILKAAYDAHASYQRPNYPSPKPIDHTNWKDHLGDRDYYDSYLRFFTSQLKNEGISSVLEKYIFSKVANSEGPTLEGTTSAPSSMNPHMLNRYMSGLVHPMIHGGNGIEFGMIGSVAQGLAMGAVTAANSSALFPPDFFDFSAESDPLTSLAQISISSQETNEDHSVPSSKGKSSKSSPEVHSFTLLANMLKDPRLEAGKTCKQTSTAKYMDTLSSTGDVIREYAKQWSVNSIDQVEEKLEELCWLATIVYGLGGFRDGHRFRADFFLIHMVTSTLFVPSYLSQLSFPSQSALLRAQLSVILAYWVSRGRPQLPIVPYYNHTKDYMTFLPKALRDIHPSKDALPSGSADPSNIWPLIIESSLNHPEEHLIKAVRSLAHWARLYGTRERGYFDENRVHLSGVGELDGTLFERVALLSIKTLGWVREGEDAGSWDRVGLGWDHLWE